MIKVENLRKIYNPDKSSSSVGLYHVTFTLPSKGMVFVVGKSGSGKSTLLNILGGLDTSSGGNITIDGNDFSSFSENDLDNYRNNYLGFIFQDYHLIESLTIKENIKLALDLQGIRNTKKRIKEVLEIVELDGYENRYPRELSGGQQQRVAIARAIVKKPKLILADEPTGNLDSKISRNILKVLKRISKETLVVIVSHNDEDAQFYADRIIELSDGRVIRDVERKSEEETQLISGNIINIPYNRKLNHEEQIIVNNALKTGKYKLNQQSDSFAKTKRIIDRNEKVKIKSKRMGFFNILKLSSKFKKGNKSHTLITSLMMSFIVILLSICQIFSSFNGDFMLDDAKEFNKDSYYVLNKGYYSNDIYPVLTKTDSIEITDEEIDNFYEKGYKGKVYKLYNKFLPFHSSYYHGNSCKNKIYTNILSTYFYTYQGRGVLDCDEEFLLNKYGINGKIDVLAGSLDPSFKDNGSIIITDYAAHCLEKNFLKIKGENREETYQNIIDKPTFNNRYQVKAIINTNYEERYADLISKYNEILKITNKSQKNEEIRKMKLTDDYVRFDNEINQYLSIGYYIGEDSYYDAINKDQENNHHAILLTNYRLIKNGKEIVLEDEQFRVASERNDYQVNKGETILPFKTYNRIFGTNITKADQSEFKEQNIVINIYDHLDEYKEKVMIQKTYKIIGLSFTDYSEDYIYIDEEEHKKLYDLFLYPSALYFDNIDSITSIYNPNDEKFSEFYSNNKYYDTIYKILDMVVIFNELFIIIVVGLALIAGFLMTSYSRKNVKRKQLDIGIFRAIGGKNKHVYQIFFVQTLTMVITIGIVSSIGMILFDDLINMLLIESLMRDLNTNLIQNMVIIEFKLKPMIIINGIIAVITLITSTSIISILKRLKPINIIRNKDKGLLDK